MASLIILSTAFVVFLFICGKIYADPEKREQIIRDAQRETLMRKARKIEKKRQKYQAWDEINMLWMMSDWLWDSDKKEK